MYREAIDEVLADIYQPRKKSTWRVYRSDLMSFIVAILAITNS
jgi:hypothetical protein